MEAARSLQPQPVEHHEFEVDKSIIKHLITSQAGSIEKGLLEAVMNSLDAEASAVSITFADKRSIVIEDNGRGFASREEILKVFKIFGFDHNTEEQKAYGRKLGAFGLGRGQLMAFGRTLWESNHYRMDVDIHAAGMGFELSVSDQPIHQGVRITVDLYEPISRYEIEGIKNELRRQILYTPMRVYVDGELVNRLANEERWTEETEQFYFKLKPNSQTGIELYNLGVFVRTYSHHQMGVSGVLVSKAGCTFDLNMARNDVLQSKCQLFADAKKLIRKYAEQRRQKATLNEADRYNLLMQWVAGEHQQDLSSQRLFKDIRGRFMSMKMVERHAGGQVVIAHHNHDSAGERIHEEKMATVLSPEVKEWLNLTRDSDVIDKLNQLRRQSSPLNAHKPLRFANYAELRRQFTGQHQVIAEGDWTSQERILMAGLKAVSKELCQQIYYALYPTHDVIPERNLGLGKSMTSQAWTDGKAAIIFNSDFVKQRFKEGVDGVLRLLAVWVHEYLHEEPDGEAHVHSPEFLDGFEKVMTSPFYNPFSLAQQILKRVEAEAKKQGKRLNRSTLNALDDVEALQEVEVGLFQTA